MTKFEMAMEIMKNVKWLESNKRSIAKGAEKHHSKARVTELYENYLKDKEHALFYASLL